MKRIVLLLFTVLLLCCFVGCRKAPENNDGVKEDEEIPTDESVARMEALYPNGRGMLKRRPDQQQSREQNNEKATNSSLQIHLYLGQLYFGHFFEIWQQDFNK